jgi:hypothetical protein
VSYLNRNCVLLSIYESLSAELCGQFDILGILCSRHPRQSDRHRPKQNDWLENKAEQKPRNSAKVVGHRAPLLARKKGSMPHHMPVKKRRDQCKDTHAHQGPMRSWRADSPMQQPIQQLCEPRHTYHDSQVSKPAPAHAQRRLLQPCVDSRSQRHIGHLNGNDREPIPIPAARHRRCVYHRPRRRAHQRAFPIPGKIPIPARHIAMADFNRANGMHAFILPCSPHEASERQITLQRTSDVFRL